MNPSLRWKSERMGRPVSVALLASLLVAVSSLSGWCGVIAAQEGLGLRPLQGDGGRRKVVRRESGGGVADKVSPDVMLSLIHI